MRLDKMLAHAGYGTRKEVKKLIKSGAISVQGQVVSDPGYNVDPAQDLVTYLDDPIHYQKYYYVMLHKPAGLVSAKHDNVYETVVEWVDLDYHHVDLFPVGRLDVDTTGLLLLTNHGQLAHQLLAPKHEVVKCYQAWVDGLVTEDDIDRFQEGLDLGDFVSLPAELRIIEVDSQQEATFIEVDVMEGKFHQVKRMFDAIDKPVLALKRLSMGPLWLDETLAEGDYRELTAAEMDLLRPYGLE